MLKKLIFLSFVSIASVQANEPFISSPIESTAVTNDTFKQEIKELYKQIEEKVKVVCRRRNENLFPSQEETKLHLKEFIACEAILHLFDGV